MFSKLSCSKALFMGLSLFISHATNAALTPVGDLIQVSVLITPDSGNNDCAGYFGANFELCEITHVPSSNTEVFATIMGKIDAEDLDDSEFTDGYSSDDWTFSPNLNNVATGTWDYVGSSYPGVSFWAAKAGPDGFILNWMVSQGNVDNNNCQEGNEFIISCLSVVIAVTSGNWAAPDSHNISHISFYGNKCENNCGPTTNVPEPTSLALFALALLGIVTRRKHFTK